jgi:hypothetical protein
MPDQQSYLRFDQKIVGRSRYRPTEGWIDLLGHGVVSRAAPAGPGAGGSRGRDDGPPEYVLAIRGVDPVAPLVAQAHEAGTQFAKVLLDVRSGGKTTRVTMTDAVVSSFQVGETCQFTFNFRAHRVGDPSAPENRPPSRGDWGDGRQPG